MIAALAGTANTPGRASLNAGHPSALCALRLRRHPCWPHFAVAAYIASLSLLATGEFFANWMRSWLASWALMLPIVLFAVPAIRGA
jgi:hypothetical protein